MARRDSWRDLDNIVTKVGEWRWPMARAIINNSCWLYLDSTVNSRQNLVFGGICSPNSFIYRVYIKEK